MQRVRVGLTGLACVFLLVMLATAFLGAGRSSVDEPAGNAVTNASETPSEPLAQLGVVPGNPQADQPTAQTPHR